MRGRLTPIAAVLVLLVSGESRAQSLDELAFMAGCWEGPISGTGTIEEMYSTPSENLIVGTTRYLRSGRAVQFEFTRIESSGEEIVLTPYPGGVASPASFELTTLEPGRAIFEAPEHDFPKRIIYRRNADGSRTARIDGGEGSPDAMEWHMQRVACPIP
jgi:hypothetical protein